MTISIEFFVCVHMKIVIITLYNVLSVFTCKLLLLHCTMFCLCSHENFYYYIVQCFVCVHMKLLLLHCTMFCLCSHENCYYYIVQCFVCVHMEIVIITLYNVFFQSYSDASHSLILI